VKAQLALALLAVGPLKSGTLKAAATAAASDKKGVETKDPRDPIAVLAREWLAKR
jgi:hypothetical protein